MFKLFAALLLLVTGAAYTQEITNSFKYDYTAMHNSGSTSVTRHFAEFNFTQHLQNSSLLYTAGVSNYTIQNNALITPFNSSTLEGVTSIKAGITYMFPLSGNWKGVASFTPEVNTNFEGTSIKDLYPAFFVGVSKTTSGESPSTLTVGVGYKGYFGKFRFMPVINYSKKVNEKISYNLGIPATEFAYKFNTKHTLKSVVFADAIYTRIGGEDYIFDALQNTDVKISKLEMLSLNAGLEYNYLSADDWIATIKGGYSFYNSLTVSKQTGGDTNVNFNNSLYISIGFKYNLNF
ncbi:hypothetical protein FMM05_03190 [Flavobacterium zepuense]|uniref:DUF6268 domain-containing protein n=1 Tax=Flavobacterium zepuense TaxID=2593302 RepID=A0A552V7F5_9FLAO|nr:DUF6268 family outer membrane beta-barrel protein [Flavobacterium zepuense]TRW26399.1 hypothetical protein FMM05_03190 [Flavobacterium zepuense]